MDNHVGTIMWGQVGTRGRTPTDRPSSYLPNALAKMNAYSLVQ